METFMRRFRFQPDATLHVGVERECFLTRENGIIIPIAPQVLELLPDRKRFGYELSACQLEDRIGPCSVQDISAHLESNENELRRAEKLLNFKRLYTEVAPADMPLDIFPDPTGRYQEITKGMPQETLLAACRVAAIHIHIGMLDHSMALNIYNKVIKHLNRLCELGNGSNGQRLDIYRTMAPDYIPRPYSGWKEFHAEAVQKGFDQDPRRCWHLIRLSVHGTIEFRMFGSTSELEKIESWTKECHSLCKEALKS